jgi:hypothetical protein
MRFGFDPLETEDCVRKLLQAIVCPPAAAEPGGSSSSSVMHTGCGSGSSSSVPEVEGTAAGDSSSSSLHMQWSVTVATAAVDALSFLIDESEIGFAAAAKHASLLLSAMQNTQQAYIARRAGEFVLETAQGGEMNHICTPQNIDKLLALLQQPIKHHATSNAAETAALILGLVVQADVGLQLLGEQGRYAHHYCCCCCCCCCCWESHSYTAVVLTPAAVLSPAALLLLLLLLHHPLRAQFESLQNYCSSQVVRTETAAQMHPAPAAAQRVAALVLRLLRESAQRPLLLSHLAPLAAAATARTLLLLQQLLYLLLLLQLLRQGYGCWSL